MADIDKVKQGLRCCKSCLKSHCEECPNNGDGDTFDCTADLADGALSVIEELQAEIERLQPKKGKWIEYAGDQKCSVCGSSYSDLYPEYSRTPFCPHCGAKMEGGDGERR